MDLRKNTAGRSENQKRVLRVSGLARAILLLAVGFFLAGCASLSKQELHAKPADTGRAAPVEPTAVAARESFAPLRLAENASLEDYLRYAALNNAGLEAVFKRWQASLERIPQVKSLPDPRFNYTYFIERVETRVGPQRQKFAFTQTFPWFGKLQLQGAAAAAAAAAAEQVYQISKLALFYRVKAAYHEYWYLAQAIAITRQHLKLVTNLEGVARMRFKTAVAPSSAALQAQVELGKLTDRLRTLEALQKPIVAKLNAALNRPTQLPLPWPRALPESSASFTDEQALQWLNQSNPDLQRLDHLVTQEEVGIKLAQKNYYPDINLGIDVVQTDEAMMSGTKDSGKDPVMAMISVNLPIWYAKYRAAEREAHLRMAAAEEDRVDTGKRLEADLELALYQFRDAERKIDLYGDTLVPKAEQALKIVQQEFETASAGFSALIDAQRLLLEFQLAHRRAQADRAQRLAEIEMLVGRELIDAREIKPQERSEQ